jgi:uncharacterized protein (TIGR02996 family)
MIADKGRGVKTPTHVGCNPLTLGHPKHRKPSGKCGKGLALLGKMPLAFETRTLSGKYHMQQEAAFLQSILEAPEDDTPRLVFADWLDEQNQAARAEFIRVQVKRTKTDEDDPEQDSLACRERDLWGIHAGQWLEELPTWARKKAVFRRGFAEEITAKAAQFVKGAKALFAVAPVRRAHLIYPISGARENPDPALAACPYLERLISLKLGGSPHSGFVGDGGIRSFAASPHVGGLRSLDLSNNNISADGLRALAAAPHLTRLVALDLNSYSANATDNNSGDGGVEALAASPHLAGLRELRLAGNRVSASGIRALASSANLKNLVALELGGNALGSEGGKALTQASNLVGRLTELRLSTTEFGSDALLTLFTSGAARHLATVDLTECGAGLGTFRQIFASPAAKRLTHLTLDRAALGDDPENISILKPLRLRSLSVNGNGIHEDVIRLLAAMPVMEGLRELDLSMNELADGGARALAESPRSANLRVLNLFANAIGSPGAEALANSPHLARLQQLQLNFNKIGDAGARALVASTRLPNLLRLQLGSNPIRKDAKGALHERFGAVLHLTKGSGV